MAPTWAVPGLFVVAGFDGKGSKQPRFDRIRATNVGKVCGRQTKRDHELQQRPFLHAG